MFLRAALRSRCHALISLCGKSVLPESLDQIAVHTDFFVVPQKARDRLRALQKHILHFDSARLTHSAKLREASMTVLLVFFADDQIIRFSWQMTTSRIRRFADSCR